MHLSYCSGSSLVGSSKAMKNSSDSEQYYPKKKSFFHLGELSFIKKYSMICFFMFFNFTLQNCQGIEKIQEK
jgi:hypothetical protein